MGRGRAKAKQTKVARQLKYNAPQTDLDALRAELSGSSSGYPNQVPEAVDDVEEDTEDPYARYVEDDDDDDDATSVSHGPR